MVKNPPANAADRGSIPGSGRSSGGGNGNTLQYSCLGNSMDRGACRLQSMGSQRVKYDLVTKQQQQQQRHEYGGGGLVIKLCPTLVIPWTVACKAPLSMGFSRQEYWSGLPFPSPGDLLPT